MSSTPSSSAATRPAAPALKTGAPPRPPWIVILGSAVTSCLALLALVGLGATSGHVLLIPPMAASMALVAGAPNLPLAQPRNVIGGQVLSALVGVAAGLIGHTPWIAAIAGGLALGVMLIARAAHSPAAATAVLGALVQGWVPAVTFVVCAGAAAIVLVLFGRARCGVGGPKYPTYWV